MNTQTLSSYYSLMRERFSDAGFASPDMDARLLISHVLELSDTDFICHKDRMLFEREKKSLDSIMKRRLAHESVARIMGHRGFWKHDFLLSEDTLEPRPDTETLIEGVLRVCKPLYQEKHDQGGVYRILDLGTGSGCILISLLHELSAAQGMGVDISLGALEIAKRNAWRIGVEDRCSWIESNWCDSVLGKYDLIVSNPPYIDTAVIEGLQGEVKNYDPMLALDGGEDGLDVYRHLAKVLPEHIESESHLFFEVGMGQANDVANLFEQIRFGKSECIQDLGSIERVVHIWNWG